jgi:hypothetical protein
VSAGSVEEGKGVGELEEEGLGVEGEGVGALEEEGPGVVASAGSGIEV